MVLNEKITDNSMQMIRLSSENKIKHICYSGQKLLHPELIHLIYFTL